MKRKLKIDDALDVFPVHGIGGVIGSLFTGIFAASQFGGLGLPEGVTISHQVGVQALAIFVTAVWSAIFSYAILKALDVWIGLRVNGDEEIQGLDIALHEETGYHSL